MTSALKELAVTAAVAVTAAIPTLVVYILLQKQFIAELTLAARKGSAVAVADWSAVQDD